MTCRRSRKLRRGEVGNTYQTKTNLVTGKLFLVWRKFEKISRPREKKQVVDDAEGGKGAV